jgi:hypothetical protein
MVGLPPKAFKQAGCLTFDLSGKRGPTSSYATAGIALGIIWLLKSSHYLKVETSSGGKYSYTFM